MVKLHPLADLGRCRPQTRQVAEEFVKRFPILQTWAFNPESHGEHGEGRALDLMVFVTDDQEIGEKGRLLGDRIFDAMWRGRVRLGVEYIIWNRHIISTQAAFQPGVLRPYTGDNPHTDHVHTTFVEKPPTYQPEPPVPVIVPDSKQEIPMRRSPFRTATTAATPPQPLNSGAWTRIRLADDRFALNTGTAAGLFAYDAAIVLEGLPPGKQIQVRSFTSTSTGAETEKSRTGSSFMSEFTSTAGRTFCGWSQIAQEIEADEFLRIEVRVAGTGVSVVAATSKAIFWKGA